MKTVKEVSSNQAAENKAMVKREERKSAMQEFKFASVDGYAMIAVGLTLIVGGIFTFVTLLMGSSLRLVRCCCACWRWESAFFC